MSTTETRAERLRRAIADMEGFLAECATFEGRYVGRLSEADKKILRRSAENRLRAEDTDRDHIEWPYPTQVTPPTFNGKKPRVVYTDVHVNLSNCRQRLQAIEWIESHPDIDEYRRLRDALAETAAKIDEDAKETAEQDEPSWVILDWRRLID